MDYISKSINSQPDTIIDNFDYYIEQVNNVCKEIKLDYKGKKPFILFTGMGASYFACHVPYNYLVINGEKSSLYETSELVYYQYQNIPEDSLIVMVSQSGESVELKKMLNKIPKGSRVLTVTNNSDSTIGQHSHYIINLNINSDQGVAINTYISSILALLIFAQKLIMSQIEINMNIIIDISSSMKKWINNKEEKLEIIDNFLGDIKLDFITVGRGPSLSSADEAALLFREISKVSCLNISGGQFRHGSVEAVNENTCVINFAPAGRTQGQAFKLTDELLNYGAKVMLISDGSFEKQHENLLEISINNKDEFVAPIYDILPCQIITQYLAKKRNIRPGIFINTEPVIVSE